MGWPHKDLLDITHLSREDIDHIFKHAASFQEINARPVKKVPTLKGRTVVLFFAEPSTRTKTSFDMAAKRLSADSFSLGGSSSSLVKGESLKDTALTLQAMSLDALVVRHKLSGAAAYLASKIDGAVINAGDGWHAHPTQALLDSFSLHQEWGSLEGKTVVILGDVTHSRVARSNVRLLTMLGAEVRLCAPRTLLPKAVDTWPVEVYHKLDDAVRGANAIMCLRLQLERQAAGLLPDMREYANTYGLGLKHLELAAPDVKIMHPGPINRGLEISSDVADHADSLILDQVGNGVAVRMALLYLYTTRKEPQE